MCLHSKTEIVQTPELKHYGKRVCSDCGKFITWVKDPELDDQHVRRTNEITFILRNPINGKDRDFLEAIRKQRVLTPKQQKWYNNIRSNLSKFLFDEFEVSLDDWYFYTFGSHDDMSDQDVQRMNSITSKLNGDDYNQF